MRRVGTGLATILALTVFCVGLGSGSAGAAGNEKLVAGTVYDSTCATACIPECPPPPHCGPIPASKSRADVVCAQASIVCPLYDSPRICLPSGNCGGYPVYAGEGAVVNVRRRGSSTVLATLTVVEGHFKIRLGRGEYVFHPYLPEEPCWSGEPAMVRITAKLRSPVPAAIDVSDRCAAHPDN